MAHHHHDQNVPRPVLWGAAVLVLLTFALAFVAREQRLADPPPTAPVQEMVELRFEDRPDGSVAVLDAKTDREVEIVRPAEGGFIRGVMRGMFRTRKLESIHPEEHFRLMRLADGALVLEDPQSGHRVDLRSFGDTNRETFEQLLAAGRNAS